MCGKRCSFYSCTTLVLTFRRLIFINFFHSVQYSDLITTKIWNNFHPQLNFDGFNTAHDVTLKCQCSQIFGIISVLFGQWVISCIYDISSFVEGTTIPATSTVGTAVSVNFLFMPREVDTLTFIVNDDSSKCAEQRTDEREGVKCGRCFRTNRTHFFLLSGAFSSSGSVCIDIPSVWRLFVQVAWLGPPATQYLPPRGCGALLELLAMLICRPAYDVTTQEEWLLEKFASNLANIGISNSHKISSTGPNFILIAENKPRELVDLFPI